MANKYLSYGKNLATYFGASLIPLVLNLVSNPWIAKNMSPEDYAVSGYYTSFSSLISPVILFYMVHYYIKEYFHRDEDGRRQLRALIAKALIWFSGLVSLICFIALYVYLRWIKSNFEFAIIPYLAFMVFALPLTGLLTLEQANNRMQRNATAYFWLTTLSGVLGVAANLLLVVALKYGAFGKLLAPLMANAIVFLWLLKKYLPILKIKTTVGDFKTVFVFCLPLALSAMLGYFTNGFSTTYLESVGQVTEYGIYIVGVSIGAYLTVFSTAVGNTFQPDLYEAVIKRQWWRYAKVCMIEIGFAALTAIVFIILAPYIISILTAGRYVASTPYAQIIALSTISSTIYFLINQFSIATDHPRLYLYTSIAGSIFIVVCTPVAVSRWQFYGGAWMSVVSFIAYSIINLALLLGLKLKHKL